MERYELVDGALPTRSRPGPAPDAQTDWAAYCHAITALPDALASTHPQALARLQARPQAAPTRLDTTDLNAWLSDLLSLWQPPWRDWSELAESALQDPRLTCLTAFVRWRVATAGGAAMIDAALPLRDHDTGRYAGPAMWNEPLAIALRLSLPAIADDTDYDATLTHALQALAQQPDAGPFLAFILADDRPAQHLLQIPMQLAAHDPNKYRWERTLSLLALQAESPAAQLGGRLLNSRTAVIRTSLAVDPDVIYATIIASARQRGESGLPALTWLLDHPLEDDKAAISRAILASRADEAVATLMPHYTDRDVQASVRAAEQAYPAWMLGQWLGLISSRRHVASAKGGLARLAEQHDPAKLQSWASEFDNASRTALDTFLTRRSQPTAPREALPALLQTMPWRSPPRRVKKGGDVVELTPIPTAFVVASNELQTERRHRRDTDIVIRDLDQIGHYVHQGDPVIKYGDSRLGDTLQGELAPLPAPDALSGEQWLAWLTARFEQLDARALTVGSYQSYVGIYHALPEHHEDLALALWAQPRIVAKSWMEWEAVAAQMLARFGERAAPDLGELAGIAPQEILPMVMAVDSGHLAPHLAGLMRRVKKFRPQAAQWLRRYRHTAMMRLLPDAVGPAGPARDVAEQTLRWFVGDAPDGQAALNEVIAVYAANDRTMAAKLAQILAYDPADDVPAKPPVLPSWFHPAALTRPVLKDGHGALSDDAMRGLAEMLTISPLGVPYVGIARVRAALTPDSAADFAWDVFEAWLEAGAPPKENWAMRALGWLGDDECARRLTAMIRKWPGDGLSARAVTGLDVLADIGSDVALMYLNGIAEKLKFKGLQEKAREKIAAIAEARDLSAEELADRLAPDLGLDARGGMTLDFGPRQFRVGFDEFLKPWVKDADGRRLKDLPKPVKSDDADLAKQASATWSALKKNTRAAASLQLERLEVMLADSRRVPPAVFQTFFAAHPLVRHLAQRLVWGIFASDDRRERPVQTFRVAEDLSAADVDDDAVTLDLSADAESRVGLVHPLHMDDAAIRAWGLRFGEYEISQPFAQLTRDTYALDDSELARRAIDRFADIEIETARLRGGAPGGWRLGAPQDGGVSIWMERPVRYVDGAAGMVYLPLNEGVLPYDTALSTQTLSVVALEDAQYYHHEKRTFADLDSVSISEILRGLTRLVQRPDDTA